ncbi:MAG: transposase, partial [Lachnospiraceae bacterium]|nr:transposase [Lachnospiraceae bacterium]
DRLADFIFNEEGTRVLQCPAGHEPKSCTFMKPSGQCMVSFQKEYCENCPHKNKCKPKIFKRVSKVLTSKAASERAKTKRFMKTDEFKNYARLRNGVETVPSNLRKNYHLEKLPRGKQRGKFFFGCKIIALNFRKLFNFTKGLGHYAQNPVIA